MSFLILYLIVYFSCGVAAFVEISYNDRYKVASYRFLKNGMFLLLAICLLCFTAHYIAYSGDYWNYCYFFHALDGDKDFSQNVFLYSYEIGFKFFSFLLAKIWDDNVHSMVVTATLIPICSYLFLFKLNSAYAFLSLSIYVAHFHWWLGFVLLRQMYAVCFLLLALYFLSRSKLIYYILFVVLATLFHSSAAIFLLFPLWNKLQFSFKWRNALILAAVIVGKVGVTTVLPAILPYFSRGEAYEGYLDARMGLNILSYIEMYIVFFLLSMRSHLIASARYRLGIDLSFFSLVLCGVLIDLEIAARMAMYFSFVVYIFIFPMYVKSLRLGHRLVITCVMLAYLFLFLYRFIYITIPTAV